MTAVAAGGTRPTARPPLSRLAHRRRFGLHHVAVLLAVVAMTALAALAQPTSSSPAPEFASLFQFRHIDVSSDCVHYTSDGGLVFCGSVAGGTAEYGVVGQTFFKDRDDQPLIVGRLDVESLTVDWIVTHERLEGERSIRSQGISLSIMDNNDILLLGSLHSEFLYLGAGSNDTRFPNFDTSFAQAATFVARLTPSGDGTLAPRLISWASFMLPEFSVTLIMGFEVLPSATVAQRVAAVTLSSFNRLEVFPATSPNVTTTSAAGAGAFEIQAHVVVLTLSTGAIRWVTSMATQTFIGRTALTGLGSTPRLTVLTSFSDRTLILGGDVGQIAPPASAQPGALRLIAVSFELETGRAVAAATSGDVPPGEDVGVSIAVADGDDEIYVVGVMTTTFDGFDGVPVQFNETEAAPATSSSGSSTPRQQFVFKLSFNLQSVLWIRTISSTRSVSMITGVVDPVSSSLLLSGLFSVTTNTSFDACVQLDASLCIAPPNGRGQIDLLWFSLSQTGALEWAQTAGTPLDSDFPIIGMSTGSPGVGLESYLLSGFVNAPANLTLPPAVSERLESGAGRVAFFGPAVLQDAVSAQLPNSLPVAETTGERTPLRFNLTGTSSNPDLAQFVAFIIVSLPSSGQLFEVFDEDGDVRVPITTVPRTLVQTGVVTLLYIPDVFIGVDEFLFRPTLFGDTGPVRAATIDVVPVNDPPVAANVTQDQFEDFRLREPLQLIVTDIDRLDGTQVLFTGDAPLQAIITRLPSRGVLEQLNGTRSTGIVIDSVPTNVTDPSMAVAYVPNRNFVGRDTFEYVGFDGGLFSVTPGTATITVFAVNDAPVARDRAFTGLLGLDTDVFLDGFDIDNGRLGFIVTSLPTNAVLYQFNCSIGVVSTADNDCKGDVIDSVNTPITDDGGRMIVGALNFVGANVVRFEYRSTDGSLESDFTATVSISIAGTTVLLSRDLTIITDEDVPVNIRLNLEPGSFSAAEYVTTLLSLPQAGTLRFGNTTVLSAPFAVSTTGTSGPLFVFTPDPETSGVPYATFRFQFSDQFSLSVASTATINVVATNDVPVATNVRVSSPEHQPVTVQLIGTDAEGSPLTATITSLPSVGTLRTVGANPSTITSLPFGLSTLAVEYLPPPTGSLIVVFNYTLSDEEIESPPATVTVTVGGTNTAPVVTSFSVNVFEDVATQFALAGSDAQSTFIPIIEQLPARGSLFQYLEAAPDHIGQPIVLVGTRIADGLQRVVYRSSPDATGTDEFTYSAVDTDGAASVGEPATAAINIIARDDVPRASDFGVTVREDTTTGFRLAFIEVDGDPVSAVLFDLPPPSVGVLLQVLEGANVVGVEFPAIGVGPEITEQDLPAAVTNSNQQLLFRPALNVEGTNVAQVRFGVFDTNGNGGMTNGTITFSVTGVNDAPTVVSIDVTIVEDDLSVIQLQAIDPEANQVTFRVESLPTRGSLFQYTEDETGSPTPGARIRIASGEAVVTDSLGRVLYQPNLHVTGNEVDSFTASASDQIGATSAQAGSVLISITNVNDAPVVRDLSIIVSSDAPINITVPVSEVDPDVPLNELRVEIVHEPVRGQLFFLEPGVGLDMFPDEAKEVEPGTFVPLSKSLIFSPLRGDATGGGFPYGNFTFRAIDEGLSSSLATVSLLVRCALPLVNNVWSQGSVCRACPSGGLCSTDGDLVPQSQAGFFQLPDFTFIECRPRDACPQGASADNGCAVGYTGLQCGECSNGFYRVGFRCKSCSGSERLVLLGLLIPLAIVLSLALIYIGSKDINLGFARIIVTYFQTLAIFPSLQLSWSSSVESVFDIASIFNFNIDVASLECSVPGASYGLKWSLVMLAPLLVLLLFFCVYGIGVLWFRYRRPGGAQMSQNRQLEKRQELSHVLFTSYVTFLAFAYIPLCSKSLELFDCTKQPDGWSLDALPAIRCYTDDAWLRLAPWGAAAVVVYVAGIPLLFAYILFRLRPLSPQSRKVMGCCCCMRLHLPVPLRVARYQRERDVHRRWEASTSFVQTLKNVGAEVKPTTRPPSAADQRLPMPQVQERTGFESQDDLEELGEYEVQRRKEMDLWRNRYRNLERYYAPQTFFWELMIMARKLLLVVFSLFVAGYPLLQGLCVLAVLVAFTFMQTQYRPYRDGSQLNRLELLTLVSACAVLISGLLFFGVDFDATSSGDDSLQSTQETAITVVSFVVIGLSFAVISYFTVQLARKHLICNRAEDSDDDNDDAFRADRRAGAEDAGSLVELVSFGPSSSSSAMAAEVQQQKQQLQHTHVGEVEEEGSRHDDDDDDDDDGKVGEEDGRDSEVREKEWATQRRVEAENRDAE